MTCHVCGGEMRATITDLPFKPTPNTIVILKGLPVLQCDHCGEYLLEDPVMERVEVILGEVDSRVELHVLRYAA